MLERLQQAADALVQRLLGMALDGDAPDHVALQAIRDALDRAGMSAKAEVSVELKPWKQMMGEIAGIATISRDEHLARQRPTTRRPAASAELAVRAKTDLSDAVLQAAARRRLDAAADVLVQRLLGMALDGDAPDHVALAAIRDALDAPRGPV